MNLVMVLSGKGGVGKSLVAANLAYKLRDYGKQVSLFDFDISNPNLSELIGATEQVTISKDETPEFYPVIHDGIEFFSMASICGDKPVSMEGAMYGQIIRDVLSQHKNWKAEVGVCDMSAGLCLTKDSLIYTNPQGVIPLYKVNSGFQVYAFEGKLFRGKKKGGLCFDGKLVKRAVKRVISNGVKSTYRLVTRTRQIRATSNHPFLTLRRKRMEGEIRWTYCLDWVSLGQLKKGDLVAVVNSIQENGEPMTLPKVHKAGNAPHFHVTIPEKTTIDFMRIIGFFLGDGFVKHLKNRLHGVILCEPEDGRYRQKYMELMKRVFQPTNIYQDKGEIGILSKEVAELFVKLELDHYAEDKHVPSWVFSLPKDQKLGLIEGFIDADGHRKHNQRYSDRRCILECASEKLIQGIRALAISVGLRVSNIRYRKRENKTDILNQRPKRKLFSETWSFSIIYDSKYRNSGFGPTNRIRDLYTTEIGWERVHRIEYSGEEEVFDLEVEGAHNFVANGLIVHNSDPFLEIVNAFGENLLGSVVVFVPAHVESAKRLLRLHRNEGVPVLGIIENFAYFKCPSCEQTYHIFGEDLLSQLAEEFNVKPLGSIPLSMTIRKAVLDHNPVLSSPLDEPINAMLKEVLEAKPVGLSFAEKIKEKLKGVARDVLVDVFAAVIEIANEEVDLKALGEKHKFSEGRIVELDVTDETLRKVKTQVFLQLKDGVWRVVRNPKIIHDEVRVWDKAFIWAVLGRRTDTDAEYSLKDAWLSGRAKYFSLQAGTQRALRLIRDVWEETRNTEGFQKLRPVLEKVA